MPEDDGSRTVTGALLRGLLRASGATVPADIQSIIGLAQGIKQTGKMPTMEGDAVVFRIPAGEMPRAAGQVVFLPEDASPESSTHERRHATQSAAVPLAPAIGSIGGLLDRSADLYTNPLEMDAYLSQPDSPETRTDLETIRSLASPARMSIMRFLAENLHGKKLQPGP